MHDQKVLMPERTELYDHSGKGCDSQSGICPKCEHFCSKHVYHELYKTKYCTICKRGCDGCGPLK